jgi:hypothetical protein
MKRPSGWIAVVLAVLVVPGAGARNPPSKSITASNVLAVLGGGSVDALAGTLRGFIIQALPTPLYEDTRHWGLQKPIREVKWRSKPNWDA